jgi:hydrogenase/urease accessory protein HupE
MIVLAAAAVMSCLGRPAHAHWADLAVAEIAVREAAVEMTLVFPTGLAAPADLNRDGRLSAREVLKGRERLRSLLADRVRMTADGMPGALTVHAVEAPPVTKDVNIPPGAHSTLRLIYSWPAPVHGVTIYYGLFEPGVSTASCLATLLLDGRLRSHVFTPESRELTIRGDTGRWQQVRSFLVLGVEHILTGYDHLLFLLSLLVAGGALRGLVRITTAFTVAHSITLSLAVLRIVALPAQWVESAIALSITVVAVENLTRRGQVSHRRWLLAFAFGLVHGLGFASVLQEFALPRADLAVSLLSFNLGVEVGQIAVVAGAFALLQIVARRPVQHVVRRFVSVGAAVAGLAWFVQRAFPF